MNSSFHRLNREGGVAVAPSLLSADFSCLREEIGAVERGGAGFLHLDVMDGNFVPNLTFGPFIVKAIAKISRLPMISHLMIRDPGFYAEQFVKAGSALVSFHWEALAEGHADILRKIHSLDCAAGIAVNPDTPIGAVEHLLGEIECLTVMTVFPGFGGQGLIESALAKIGEAAEVRRRRSLDFVIEVDGGIKPGNAALVRDSGAQILVAGTGVFHAKDYAEAIASIGGVPRRGPSEGG